MHKLVHRATGVPNWITDHHWNSVYMAVFMTSYIHLFQILEKGTIKKVSTNQCNSQVSRQLVKSRKLRQGAVRTWTNGAKLVELLERLSLKGCVLSHHQWDVCGGQVGKGGSSLQQRVCSRTHPATETAREGAGPCAAFAPVHRPACVSAAACTVPSDC